MQREMAGVFGDGVSVTDWNNHQIFDYYFIPVAVGTIIADRLPAQIRASGITSHGS
jgi:hypothetical protein